MKTVIDHFKNNLGWYVLIPSIYLGFFADSFMFFVSLIALLNFPPFNWVEKMMDWSLKLSLKLRQRVAAIKKEVSHPVMSKMIYSMMLLFSLYTMYVILFKLPLSIYG